MEGSIFDGRCHVPRATTGFRSDPRRSTVRTTCRRARDIDPRVWSRTSRRQPVPTVPLPRRSPGRRRTSADARAIMSPNENWASDQRPRLVSEPLTVGGHGQVVAGAAARVGQLVRRHEPWPDGAREVLALGRSEPDGRLLTLQVARRPVVEDRVAADGFLGAVGREVDGRRVDEGRDLQLVVELPGSSRAPDRVVRAADLRDVAEVEDRQAVPGLGDLAAAPFPHRPDMAFEGIEVAQRRRPEDRWTKDEIGCVQDGRVIVVTRFEAVDQVAQRLDAKPAGEMVVERRQRSPVDSRVMLEHRTGADGPPSGDLEVQPAPGRITRVERGSEPPGCAGGCELLADVGDLHDFESIDTHDV